jgi:hypothetical protein
MYLSVVLVVSTATMLVLLAALFFLFCPISLVATRFVLPFLPAVSWTELHRLRYLQSSLDCHLPTRHCTAEGSQCAEIDSEAVAKKGEASMLE